MSKLCRGLLFGADGSFSPATSDLSLRLLDWWQIHGRKDPAQKPWMFKADSTWPQPEDSLSPYGIWIAEVMLYCATYMAS